MAAAVPKVVKERPAETASPVAMAVAMLIAKAFSVEDVDTIAYLAIVVSFVPAAVTWGIAAMRKKWARFCHFAFR